MTNSDQTSFTILKKSSYSSLLASNLNPLLLFLVKGDVFNIMGAWSDPIIGK